MNRKVTQTQGNRLQKLNFKSNKKSKINNLQKIKIMKTTFTILFAFLTLAIAAQEYTQTVKGTVIDMDTRVTLPGANILLFGSDPLVGASTDIDGNFKLEKSRLAAKVLKLPLWAMKMWL